MRHRVAHRKLGRVTEHRIAMLRNQAEALIAHEHIETTVPKAKELRPVRRADHHDRQARPRRAATPTRGSLHARRLVLRDIQNRDVVSKLFDTIAPRFAARPGGYTRILRLGYRRGDSAEVAQIELVGSEYDPNAEADEGRDARPRRSRRASAAACARRPSACAARPSRRAKRPAATTTRPKKKAKPERTTTARAAKPTPAARAPRRPRRGKPAARSQGRRRTKRRRQRPGASQHPAFRL